MDTSVEAGSPSCSVPVPVISVAPIGTDAELSVEIDTYVLSVWEWKKWKEKQDGFPAPEKYCSPGRVASTGHGGGGGGEHMNPLLG